ncbi:MAG: hypothetical protein HRT97_06860 [Moritella sp.]|uniref:hypothetical protein n=1 Tax=Moritella sp. TaxID=78556 RepID=UPI0025D5B9D2|nr:hypothetical protein [Moritella sp.]NQZ92048.1 hypothetical protein [Moritella sp.]
MAKNARSIKLDSAIEAELNIMVDLGIENAPISATTLHGRLKAKGVLKGKLSTLSTDDRKKMIAESLYQQMSDIEKDEDKDEDGPKYGTVGYYKARNQKLISNVSKLNTRLSANTAALAEIIRRVESQTPVKVEDLIKHILDPMEDIPF